MFGNLANFAVVSLLSVGTFATTLIAPPSPPHLICPLPLTSPTPSPLPTVTPTPLPTATPTPLPTATATPTPLPLVTGPELEQLFNRYSQQYSVDQELLKKIAFCESGFNTQAAFLDYKGLFQFSTESWTGTRQTMGEDSNPDLRSNAEEAIKTAAFKLSHSGVFAWPNCH